MNDEKTDREKIICSLYTDKLIKIILSVPEENRKRNDIETLIKEITQVTKGKPNGTVLISLLTICANIICNSGAFDHGAFEFKEKEKEVKKNGN